MIQATPPDPRGQGDRMRHRGTIATMLLRTTALAFVIAAACGGKSPAPATPGGAPAAPASGTVGTLKELQNGDRACYVVVDVDGAEQSLEGDFELCAGGGHDATALIGQRVTWTTEKAKVQAASCQGDPDCTASDEVDLIMTLAPAP